MSSGTLNLTQLNSTSAMTERPRELGDFKEVGHFDAKLNFKLKGYVSLEYLWTVRYREWLYYNFAAKIFHTHKTFSRLYSIKIELYLTKTENCF